MGYTVKQRKLKNGRRSLYVEMYSDGVKKYAPLKGLRLEPGMSKAQQKRLLADAEDQAREIYRRFDQSGPVDYLERGKIDFVDYFETLARDRCSSWKSVLHHLRKFQTIGERADGTPKLRKLPIANVDENWLNAFRTYLVGRYVKDAENGHYTGGAVTQSTACTYFQKIGKALRMAVKEKVLQINPMTLIDPISMPTDFETLYLSEEQIKSLIETPWPPSDRAYNTNLQKARDARRAYLFSVWTGLRLSDIKKLRYSDIVERNGRHVLRYRMTKTGKYKTLVLPTMALRIIQPLKDTDEQVFDLYEGKHLNVVVRQWMKAAGIRRAEDYKFHTARHTHAILSLTHEIPIYTVSKNLGHSNVRTTERYLQITQQLQSDAADKLPDYEWPDDSN